MLRGVQLLSNLSLSSIRSNLENKSHHRTSFTKYVHSMFSFEPLANFQLRISTFLNNFFVIYLSPGPLLKTAGQTVYHRKSFSAQKTAILRPHNALLASM